MMHVRRSCNAAGMSGPGPRRASAAAATRLTAAPGRTAVRIEDDDMPGAELVGVVAAPGKPEVRDRGVRAPCVVFVVPEGSARARAKAPPRVTVRELGRRSLLVDGVTEHCHRAGDPRDERRRRLVAG